MSSCNIASSDFLKQVEKIKPSKCRDTLHRPCSVVLKDGTRVERVICVEEHRGFETDAWLHPDRVDKIEESQFRMPPKLATKLYEAGESGMGYEIFKMKMKSGETFVFVTGNVVDFPNLPDGYTTKDIKKIFPHEGRDVPAEQHHRGAKFQWCFYMKK